MVFSLHLLRLMLSTSQEQHIFYSLLREGGTSATCKIKPKMNRVKGS